MIQIKNLHFSYRKNTDIFCDFNLHLNRGYIHGLLGSNGIGKTTLLKLISGLLIPHKGEIKVDQFNPAKLQPSFFNEIFFVPEEFDLPALSFKKFVQVTAPFYSHFSYEMLEYFASNMEIDENQKLDKLSMGQRKKAYLVFALACNTPLLLLDEPTNGLDIPGKATFRKMISVYADPNRTVIISTHQVRDIDNLIDSIVILDKKGVLINHTTEEITNKLYFGIADNSPEILYSEETLIGTLAVSSNIQGQDSKINLEHLFHAATSQREKLDTILNNPKN